MTAQRVTPGLLVTKGGNAVCHKVDVDLVTTVCGKPLDGMGVAQGGPGNFGGMCKRCDRVEVHHREINIDQRAGDSTLIVRGVFTTRVMR